MKKISLLFALMLGLYFGIIAQEIERLEEPEYNLVRYFDGTHYWFADLATNKTISKKYEWAQYHGSDGLAKVKRDGKDYVLDISGQEFEYADQIDKITASTTAFFFRGQNINGRTVYDIPEELLKHTQLKVLVIDAKATEIPKEIGKLVNLEVLRITAPVTKLPTEISYLVKLETLSISSYQGEGLPPEIGSLKKLKELSLTGYKLKSVPPELGQLTELKSLQIGANIQTELSFPESFGNLQNLETLSLSCGFEQIPSVITKLHNLKQLYLGGDNLKSLPAGFEALQQLEYFDLSRTKDFDISSLFIAVANSPKDIIIDDEAKINHNSTILMIKPPKFSVLPGEIGLLKNLIELRFASTTQIPPEIGQLTKLKKFETKYLSKAVESLPVEFGKLSNLTHFSVHRSTLSALPDEFSQLKALKVFELKESKLNEFPAPLLKINGLEVIDLYKNNIKDLPTELAQLTKLKLLVLIGNADLDFNSICKTYKNSSQKLALGTLQLKLDSVKCDLLIAIDYLKRISPEIAKLQTITALDVTTDSANVLNAIATLSHLQYLKLRAPKTVILPKSIWNLRGLTYLNLSLAKDGVIPPDISNLNKLETLVIRSSKLENLPISAGRLKALKTIDLTRCGLTGLPKSMGKLKALTSINLSWNQLTTLPKSMKKLKNVESLDLSGNKIEYLPKAVSEMSNLSDFKMANNPLIGFEGSMKKLSKLYTLDLETIKTLDFASLCNAFAGYPKPLVISNVAHEATTNNDRGKLVINATCNSTALPAEIGKLNSLVRFCQVYSTITSIPEELGNLKAIKHFQISKLPEAEMNKAKQLLPHDCEVR